MRKVGRRNPPEVAVAKGGVPRDDRQSRGGPNRVWNFGMLPSASSHYHSRKVLARLLHF